MRVTERVSAVVARKQTHCTLIGYRPELHARIGVVNRWQQYSRTLQHLNMTEIKLYKTPLKAIRIFLLSIPFVAIGIWQIITNEIFTFDWIMGFICTSFFGLGLVVGFFHLFDKRPQIILNENGIWDRTTKQDMIRWEQIIEAYPISINRQKFISIVTDSNYMFKTKQYKWATRLSEKVGAQKLNFQISQIKIDENRFADFINSMIQIEKTERERKLNEYFNLKH
jgi:hypothetical protein